MIGHALNMSQHEFGTWAAIAIHDMSSVVRGGCRIWRGGPEGGNDYKAECLMDYSALALGNFCSSLGKGQKISIPWFIFFFVLAMFSILMQGTTERVP